MYFCHARDVWDDYPELVPGILVADQIKADADVRHEVDELTAAAAARLASSTEGELPEIQAWRRAFSRMGLKPTQYRCAAEALLRRFRKDRSLPRIHPLVDLCNATSMAFAIPVAAFDLAKVADYLEVRYADGSELYESFSGEIEHPEPTEVIFADGAGAAHARRWTNRQSRSSAVREETSAVVVVAEAMHALARDDVQRLVDTLAERLDRVGSVRSTRLLESSAPRFDFEWT